MIKVRSINRVLIVEDDLMIADMLEEILLQEGYQVCGIARSKDEGLELSQQAFPDLAIVDVQLVDGWTGTELAEILTRQSNIGILYTSGNIDTVMVTAKAGHACLSKPFHLHQVIAALKVVSEIVKNGRATSAIPEGLIILAG